MNICDYLLKERVESELGVDYLLRNGLVELNGQVVDNPELPADKNDEIELGEREPPLRLDAGDSYWQGRLIQEETGIVLEGDTVLHFGVRDGGLTRLMEDYGGRAYLVTEKEVDGDVVSDSVREAGPGELKREMGSRADILVQEVETDALDSFKHLERLLPVLKDDGKVVLFLSKEGHDSESLKRMSARFLEPLDVEIEKFFDFDEGVYLYARLYNR